MKLEARAKTNLMLKVLAREESGYHQIETLFQLLELADAVSVRVRESPGDRSGSAERNAGTGEEIVVEGTPVIFEVRGVSADALGAPAGNLVVRAIGVYLRHFRARHGTAIAVPPLEVILAKRIPHGAGLGGGSSDAAATLRALNTLANQGWSETSRGEGGSGDPTVPEHAPGRRASLHRVRGGRALPESLLLEAAAELGSDVPFFLSPSPLTLAWGRGERLLPLPALQPRPVLLVVPPFAVATADAYAALASRRAAFPPEPAGSAAGPGSAPALLSLDDLAGWETIESLAQNDFHGPIEALHPRLGELRSQLRAGGGRIALLSGSGSALIGIFADEPTRNDMHQTLTAQPDLRLITTRTVGPSGPEPLGPEPSGPEPSGEEPSGPEPSGAEPSGRSSAGRPVD